MKLPHIYIIHLFIGKIPKSSENALILKRGWPLASAIAPVHSQRLARMESSETQKLGEAVNNTVGRQIPG